MKRRIANIAERKRVFLGCEGESERGYGRLLGDIAGSDYHFDLHVLHGGDGPAVVERAVRKLITEQSKDYGTYAVRAVLLDSDRWGKSPERDANAQAAAQKHRLRLIFQRPCHEALLLRHLDGQQDRLPHDADASEKALTRLWPGYKKPMVAKGLSARIGKADVLRAAAVEAELDAFLVAVGIIRQ